MQIIIGSLNQTKIKAVETVFNSNQIMAYDVASGVSNQPICDQETRSGAINRATEAHKHDPSGIAIGLEGGVMEVGDQLFLCNWGALMDTDGIVYTAAGARIQLPNHFKQQLDIGTELSDIMNVYTKKADIRNHEGAMGVFTNDLIDRATMFTHVVRLLKGQMAYWSK